MITMSPAQSWSFLLLSGALIVSVVVLWAEISSCHIQSHRRGKSPRRADMASRHRR